MIGRDFTTHPLTPERFSDLELVFGGKGCSFARSCWCMAYREAVRPAASDGATRAQERKAALRAIVASGPAPGLIGYEGGERPVGWISFGPRQSFPKLLRSPVMKPVDDQPVWSVVCFVVPGPCRGRGIARALLAHGLDYAGDHGARLIEGYPIDKPARSEPQWLWHGTRSMFEGAGFKEIARRKPERPVMRLDLRTARRAR